MINTLLGIKKNMTSTYDARGRRVGATVVEVMPNFVTQVKTADSKDGYEAVQLGLGSKKSVRKPQLGHLKKAGVDQKVRWLREVREDMADVKLGDSVEVSSVFSKGDAVKVTGISKGRGFQGGVRRYGFAGGPKTHGQSDRHRAPGSIGSGTTPGRVLKGKRMAGHMGAATVSVRGLEVVEVDKSKNLLIIKGGIPGATGSLVSISKLGRIKGYTPPPEEKPEEEEESEEKKVEAGASEAEGQTAIEAEAAETPEVKEGAENAG